MIEFAFGLVIALVLLAGVVDGGRALFVYMALRDAAQEGAQYAIIDADDWAGIRDRALNASNTLGDFSSDITLNVDNTLGYLVVSGQDCAGSSVVSGNTVAHGVRIRVTYQNFPLTMPFIGMFVGSQTIPISAVIEDTIITPPCP